MTFQEAWEELRKALREFVAAFLRYPMGPLLHAEAAQLLVERDELLAALKALADPAEGNEEFLWSEGNLTDEERARGFASSEEVRTARALIERIGKAKQPEATIKHVRETTFGVAPNQAGALRDLFKSDPASLEAIGQRLGAASPVQLAESSFDEAARVLERSALRCHVCGAPTEKTYTFERTYENKAYEARTMRFAGLPLCDGCVPRTQDEVDHG